MDAKEIIHNFGLQEHPEGGYYKEVYRSKEKISSSHLGNQFVGDRNYCTSIYFLLTSDKYSAFHKINQDEIWHFYSGTALKLHLIAPNGKYSFVIIGSNFKNHEVFQYTVPAQYYFAAEVLQQNSFSFVGCTVSPGFDFRDFILPSYDELSNQFPQHSKIIKSLTHH
ncbi:cupin domain-containing protein [Polaribacter sp. WD7]|uniref:cupin domain-containing protein n=1 Tax=Polaribacter sp. WD7 TaxID=2269061 RepID=UPI000DF156C1|nr:cupin domain-containing protein [Polaribacter sp. WD7]RCS27629.1 cupin domain-containing protein [Polaribacter sp. WD7]